jgi:histone-lysine N-methyltransferase SETMAR
MLHDNARPHTAAATQDLIATFGWEQFDHPPSSTDLAPSDFHVFLHLKTFLGGRRFHDDEVKETINTWFASQATSVYDAGTQKLVPRYKCLYNGGNYFEKYCKICTSDGNINGSEINTCFLFNSPSELTFWIT